MNAAIEIPIEQAFKDHRFTYYQDYWFTQPICEVVQLGEDFPVFLVLFGNGVSRQYRKGMKVYREDRR